MRTDRLDLRPLVESDASQLHALWTSPGVRRYLWDDEIIPLERTREIIDTSERLARERGLGIHGARLHGSELLIGFGGFWFFREPPVLELLYGVAEDHWNRGYATEIASAMIRHGFDTLGMTSIRAATDVPNAASVRLLEKLGFRMDRRADVGGLDTLFYQLSRCTD